MLLLHVSSCNARRRRRWRLRMTLQGMHRPHLRHSGVLTDGTGVRVMISVMSRVGRVVSMQR